ncbi:MAG: ATPase [Saprospiraceae bacterium]|nr:ATPase [Saprospiraceae bacterium]
MTLTGRKRELEKLERLAQSPKPEFLAVYGRRRVGKTFLIRTYFNNQFDFYATGLAKGSTKQQLANFAIFIHKHFGDQSIVPANWLEAFNQLIGLLEKSRTGKKRVIFIDEMPWFDTRKSDFMIGLEFFWNSWASAQSDILLIVCGSAASWMINNLIRNTGGLYNRVTERMKLESFTLKETEAYFSDRNIVLDRYQIILLYMVMGGIPYYLEQVQAGKSAMQIIEELCFRDDGKLRTEFSYIFASLFKNADRHEAVLKTIFENGGALTREELIRLSGLNSGGHVTKVLSELEESGFLASHQRFGLKKALTVYAISDFYTLFYFRFIMPAGKYEPNMWLSKVDSPDFRAWSGLAFERVCFAHVPQIKKALGISGVNTSTYIWQYKGDAQSKGSQIDLIIDRRDHVVNLFEMKFSINSFTITKEYDAVLRHKTQSFREATGTKKSVFLTMLTTHGLKNNAYRYSSVQNELTMEALFED